MTAARTVARRPARSLKIFEPHLQDSKGNAEYVVVLCANLAPAHHHVCCTCSGSMRYAVAPQGTKRWLKLTRLEAAILVGLPASQGSKGLAPNATLNLKIGLDAKKACLTHETGARNCRPYSSWGKTMKNSWAARAGSIAVCSRRCVEKVLWKSDAHKPSSLLDTPSVNSRVAPATSSK